MLYKMVMLEKPLYGLISPSGTCAAKGMTCKTHQKASKNFMLEFLFLTRLDICNSRLMQVRIQCICRTGWQHLAPVMLTESMQ